MAEEARTRGNEAFKARDFEAAVRHYSDGIDLSPDNHHLYYHRSLAYAALDQNLLALKDAVKTYELSPDWPQTYARLGYAHLELGRLDQAICSFKLGLEISPDDGDLKSGYEKAMFQAKKRVEPLKLHPLGDIFTAPSIWEKLTGNPSTGKLVLQQDFQRMMREVQRDSFNANKHSADPRLLQALGALLNVKFRVAKESVLESLLAEKEMMKVDKLKQRILEEESEDEIEVKKNLEATIRNYITEIDLEGNISELEKEKQWSPADRAAATMAKLKIDERKDSYPELPRRISVIKSENVMKRKGSTQGELYKEEGSSNNAILENAPVEVDYSEALLQSVEQAVEIADIMLKILDTNPGATKDGDEKKVLGEQTPAEVLIDHYTERLKSNPEDAELYGNRSACYLKLGKLHEALKDAEKCLELDPHLWMGYHRRGQILFRMRMFDLGVETYMVGLKRCQGNEELLNEFGRCLSQIDETGDLE